MCQKRAGEEKGENNFLIIAGLVAFLYGLSVFLVDFYHNDVIY